MPIKATVRRPAAATVTAPPPPAAAKKSPPVANRADKAPVVDIEAEVISTKDVDTTSAGQLADALEAGALVPGSEEETDQALATRPAAVPGATRSWSGGGFEGDWDDSDTKLPQLKIVNGSGELSKTFNQGTLLYADEKIWNPPSLEKTAKNPELCFVPLRIDKQFRQNLTPDEVEDGLMPRMVSSREEAESLTGEGSTQWHGQEKPKWSPSGKCVLLIQQPEGCEHPAFCTELDGKLWAMGIYYCSGMAYNHFVKAIRNTAMVSLKENGQVMLHKQVWTWEVVKNSGGKFTVFVPKIRLTKEASGPEIRALAESIDQAKNIQAQE